MAKVTCQRPFECEVFPGTCSVFLVFGKKGIVRAIFRYADDARHFAKADHPGHPIAAEDWEVVEGRFHE